MFGSFFGIATTCGRLFLQDGSTICHVGWAWNSMCLWWTWRDWRVKLLWWARDSPLKKNFQKTRGVSLFVLLLQTWNDAKNWCFGETSNHKKKSRHVWPEHLDSFIQLFYIDSNVWETYPYPNKNDHVTQDPNIFGKGSEAKKNHLHVEFAQKRFRSYCVVVFCLVVTAILYHYPYLGKWSKLTNIFDMGWKRQLVLYFC